jgi:hypothetical protein
MKMIILVVGLVLGAGGGILYSVNYPEQAAKIAGKENDLIAEGKRQALEAVKQKLDSILSDQSSQPVNVARAPGASFASGSGATVAPSDQSAKLKSLRDDVTAQINQIPAKK